MPALVAAATLVAFATDGTLPEGAMGMVYLVAAAVGFGALHGLAAAVLAFLAWNFLFLPPRYTLLEWFPFTLAH